METITIPITEELSNYINRIIFERNNLCFIMNRFFEKHARDKDDSILYDDSFLKYHKELELISYEYNILTNHISTLVNEYLTSIGIKDINTYEWSINDFINDIFIIVKKAGTRS